VNPEVVGGGRIAMRVRGSKTARACRALAVLFLVFAAPGPSLRANATIVVTNANDSGNGSLRWAITLANTTPGFDIITFQIPVKDFHKIWVMSPLPDIASPMLIDGSTQDGWCCRNEPVVELDGSLGPEGTDGLVITSNGSTVQSLQITRFTGGAGIHLKGSATGNYIYNCWIGMNRQDFDLFYPDYNDQVRNEVGVLIDGYATANWIGGADGQFTSFDRNVITGNRHGGVRIEGNAAGNAVINNNIGTDAGANVVLRNGNPFGDAIPYGVEITGNAQNNWIGSAPGPRSGDLAFGNVIAGGIYGVLIDGAASNYVQDNHIGIDKTGNVPLPNFTGIVINHGALSNVIGGKGDEAYASAYGNIITQNQQAGIVVQDDQTLGNSIRYNQIFDNGTDAGLNPNPNLQPNFPTLGVQLGETRKRLTNDALDPDKGPNHLQNFPIVGRVDNENFFSSTTYGSIYTEKGIYTIDVYASDTCHPAVPWLSPARWWYGSAVVTTNDMGAADFAIHVGYAMPENLFITAIATAADRSSSEISPCHPVNAVDTSEIAVPPQPGAGGGAGSFSVSLKNDGPSTARNVVLADTLPPAVTFASCAATHGGVCGGSGNQRFVSFRALRAGEEATVTISATLNPVVVVPPGDTVGGAGQIVTAAGSATGGSALATAITVDNTVLVTSDSFDPDPFNNIATMTLTFGGPDNEPPVIGRAAAHPDELWPPDGRLRHVHVSYAATDNVDAPDALACSLSVGGAGVTATDAEVLDAHDVRLRASRRRQGPREYDITISCADHAGNVGSEMVHVPVARDDHEGGRRVR